MIRFLWMISLLAVAGCSTAHDGGKHGPATRPCTQPTIVQEKTFASESVDASCKLFRSCKFTTCKIRLTSDTFDFDDNCEFNNCTWSVSFCADVPGPGTPPLAHLQKIVTTIETSEVKKPTALGVGTFSARQVEIHWIDNSVNDTAFEIQRLIGGAGTFTTIATPPSDVPAFTGERKYTDSNVAPNTNYTYRVRALCGQKKSDWSNNTSVTTPRS